jgi:threonine/homoserine/homoserine lactone efflux protein
MLLPEASQLTFFLTASLALLLLPGPAVFYIIARSVAQGRDAGLVSAIGVGMGSLVHVAATALGISALLASSADAFWLLRIVGALYLVYLGIRTLMTARRFDVNPRPLQRGGLFEVFREGVVVNIFNPKTAIFFVAFLPQFADPSRASVGAQILLLGGMFIVLGVLTDSVYALLAHKLSARLSRSHRAQLIRARIAAGVYFLLGAMTLNVEAPKPS